MRVRDYSAHPSIRDHWALRCMSRFPDQVVSLKRDSPVFKFQASFALIYRSHAVGMKGRVNLSTRGIELGPVVWKEKTDPRSRIEKI
ncbi:hypothetical protein TNCV_1685471 [Trichonephila clavipes]|nr:hypothetical protein TNCV_1685471 [Trichonephila clavipes]